MSKSKSFKLFGNTYKRFPEPINEINGGKVILKNDYSLKKEPQLRNYLHQPLSLLGFKNGNVLSIAFTKAIPINTEVAEMAVNIIYIKDYEELLKKIKHYLP